VVEAAIDHRHGHGVIAEDLTPGRGRLVGVTISGRGIWQLDPGCAFPWGPTTSSTSRSVSSCTTPSPTPTLSASSPSFAAPTSSWICGGSELVAVCAVVTPRRRIPSSWRFLLSSRTWFAPRTLDTGADGREDRRSKFYETLDNLRGSLPRRRTTWRRRSRPAKS